VLASQTMNTESIVSMLVAERDRLNRAIEALQGPTKRRGRPPAVAAVVAGPAKAKPTRKRRKLTAAEKKAASERMKAFWAARRKAGKSKG